MADQGQSFWPYSPIPSALAYSTRNACIFEILVFLSTQTFSRHKYTLPHKHISFTFILSIKCKETINNAAGGTFNGIRYIPFRAAETERRVAVLPTFWSLSTPPPALNTPPTLTPRPACFSWFHTCFLVLPWSDLILDQQ